MEFWALLPAFVAVTIVGAIETVGDGVAIQRVSRRRPQATDFRVVQGCLNADGLGNLLSGIAGTLPNTTYSSSISITEVTGVAARRVGVVIGVTLMVLAFFPKVAALLIAIPGPVIAAHATVFLGILSCRECASSSPTAWTIARRPSAALPSGSASGSRTAGSSPTNWAPASSACCWATA